MFPQDFTLGNCSPNLGLLASEDRVSELHSGTVRVLRLKSQHICVSLKFFFPVHMSVVSACVCLCNTCMPVLSEPTRRRVSNPVGLDLQMAVNHGCLELNLGFLKE